MKKDNVSHMALDWNAQWGKEKKGWEDDGKEEGRGLTSKHKPQGPQQQTISQVQDPTGPRSETQRPHPVEQGIQHHICRTGATGAKRSPLPVIILRAEQKVHHEDGDGGGRDDHEAVAEEEEAEHVVDAREPDGVHDKVEFDKDGAKGEDADDEHRG